MQLILQEDIYNLGKAGDIVKVREGYGRNFLLPQKKAVIANPKNIVEMEHHKKVIAGQQAKRVKEAEGYKAKIEALSVSVAKEAGEEGKLFGSVTSHEIAEALLAQGIQVDRRLIHIAEPIKRLGDFEVSVRLVGDVSAKIKVQVVKK
ncbi:MAG: 50S ribosomal protein L9 [Deltaproteobacteria bacterium]|nr:50S ribosomal protein L9 [Deltaproteobacteria bacterium]